MDRRQKLLKQKTFHKTNKQRKWGKQKTWFFVKLKKWSSHRMGEKQVEVEPGARTSDI